MDPHCDPTPTRPIPPVAGSPPADAARLSPAQRQWLIGLLIGIGGLFLGRWGIPIPPGLPPFPLEAQRQLADTAAAVKRIEAGQSQVMKLAGLPKQ